jgi:hypothetical protein
MLVPHSPPKGLKWRPILVRLMKQTHFSTTATLAWSTHLWNRKKAFNTLPDSYYKSSEFGDNARGGIDRS